MVGDSYKEIITKNMFPIPFRWTGAMIPLVTIAKHAVKPSYWPDFAMLCHALPMIISCRLAAGTIFLMCGLPIRCWGL